MGLQGGCAEGPSPREHLRGQVPGPRLTGTPQTGIVWLRQPQHIFVKAFTDAPVVLPFLTIIIIIIIWPDYVFLLTRQDTLRKLTLCADVL